jgi:hypothetical protein
MRQWVAEAVTTLDHVRRTIAALHINRLQMGQI